MSAMKERELESYVGRVVLADVQLELHLRQLFGDLVGLSHAWVLVPDNFTPLLDSCIHLLAAHPRLTTQQRKWAKGAMSAVKAVHASRNRVAHDVFVVDSAQVGTVAWRQLR